MKLGLAYFGGPDINKIQMQKQMGLDYVISGSRGYKDYASHTYEALKNIKDEYAAYGLDVTVIEGPPPLDDVKLGLAKADEQIENFKLFIKNCDKLNIRTVCYNWMPVINWYRTDNQIKTRGGALVTGFDIDKLSADERTYAGEVSEDRLWETLEKFLREIIPVCEKYEVNMALHPDDPPVSPIKGISRILTSGKAFDRVLDLYQSEFNCITMCQGSFAAMGENIPELIGHFSKKIKFVHFRDISGTKNNFHETFHDDGITDMYEAMKMYYEINYDGFARPDHVPTMHGEDNSKPSYGLLGNLFAVGYIKGLAEACEKQIKLI